MGVAAHGQAGPQRVTQPRDRRAGVETEDLGTETHDMNQGVSFRQRSERDVQGVGRR